MAPRRNVGNHDMQNVILEEEPSFLEVKRLGERIRILHHSHAHCAIGNASHECLDSQQTTVATLQGSITVVDGDSGNQIPIPRCEYIFVPPSTANVSVGGAT